MNGKRNYNYANLLYFIIQKKDIELKRNPCQFDFKVRLSFTRLHSSRMHTTRLLTVCPSMHCTGAVGVSALGGACSQAGSAPWGCLLWGVVVSARGGGW